MSTTPVTPDSIGIGSNPTNIAFDALLSSAFAETPIEEAPPVEAPPEAPPVEAVVEALVEPLVEPVEPAEDEPVTEEEERRTLSQPLDLQSSRGKRIYQGYKFSKAIADKLGFEPTVDDIESNYRLAGDIQAMTADWDSDDPRATANFLSKWSQNSVKGLNNLTLIMPEFVAHVARTTNQPQLYVQLAGGVLDRYAASLYNQAAEAADPELKKSLTLAAQVIEWQRKGTFREGPPAPTAADPLAERERAITERERALQSQYRQQQTAQQQAFVNATDAAIDANLSQSVDTALASIKASYQPAIYDAIRDKFLEQVRASVSGNGEASKQFQMRYGRAAQAPSEQAKADVIRAYASMASRAIAAYRTTFLKSAASEVVSQSGARHAQLAANAARVGLSTGAPAQRAIRPPLPASARASERLDRAFEDLGL